MSDSDDSAPSLTVAERAILARQYKILSQLEDLVADEQPDGDDEGRDFYAEAIEILSSGYEGLYSEVLDDISEPLSAKDCTFVHDILLLYYLMKLTRNKVEDFPVNKQGMHDLSTAEPKFPGFDANNQPHLHSFASFMIEKQGNYPEHKHYLNSHGRQPDYAKKVEKWRSWGKPAELRPEQVEELLKP